MVIADSCKPVERLHGTVPVELHQFGVESTIMRLGQVTLRDVVAESVARAERLTDLTADSSATGSVI